MRPTTSLPPVPSKTTLSTPCFQERYTCLKMKQFGQFHILDRKVLGQLWLDEEVRGVLSTRGWSQLFNITEDTYHGVTLEVLGTIEMDRLLTNFDRAGSIEFHLFGVQCAMSYTEFALLMGL